MSLARFVFQACSIDHSDISPFRINELQAVWNSVAQDLPSRISDLKSSMVPIVCCDALGETMENCVRPSNVVRSLTGICGLGTYRAIVVLDRSS